MTGLLLFIAAFLLAALADFVRLLTVSFEIDGGWLLLTTFPLLILSGYMGFVGIHRMWL